MKGSKKVIAFTLAAAMMLGSTMGVLAADTDVDETNNRITFQAGGGDATDPVDPENPDETVEEIIEPGEDPKIIPTGNTGSLRLDVVPAFDFGTQDITTEAKSYSAILPNTTAGEVPYYAQVTDVRGSGAGWTLSAQMTEEFSDGTHTLDGAEIVLSGIASKAQDGTTAPTGLDASSQTLSSTGNKVDLMYAKVNEGMGTSAIRFGDTVRYSTTVTADESVTLNIPASTQVYANTYTATIKWTLGATK